MSKAIKSETISAAINTKYESRPRNKIISKKLEQQGVHPLLAILFASRGVTDISEVRVGIENILPTSSLLNCCEMASILADCFENRDRVLIISDYDCDGATACAVLAAAFMSCGMNFEYLVPDRQKDSYGLTESIVMTASKLDIKPNYIITVDAGISSTDGVKLANELGMKVLITDHHHAPKILPDAELIVNPNQPNCTFESKNIAGCGVAWYVAKALHDELARREINPKYDPAGLLQFVALGTIADVVKLDKNNRILVSEGLKRIKEGRCTEGIKAIANISGREISALTCTDFGFLLGPRINAAGRLAHMSTGIECLLSRKAHRAIALAQILQDTNVERREIQRKIVEDAEQQMEIMMAEAGSELSSKAMSIVVYKKDWHQGVIGVVAGRIKEEKYRPTFVMCDADEGVAKGSGRSIPGFHLKHALDKIAVEYPGIIIGHGGHPMAAGVSIRSEKVGEFRDALEKICKEELTEEILQKTSMHDGELPAIYANVGSIRAISNEVWGQGFEEPVFFDKVKVASKNKMGKLKDHLKMRVKIGEAHLDAIAFGEAERESEIGAEVVVLYKAQVNQYNGKESVQMLVSEFPDEVAYSAYVTSTNSPTSLEDQLSDVDDSLFEKTELDPNVRPGFRRL